MGPVLLCYDGSDDAAVAIQSVARMLGPRSAVVLTVWERVAVWQPSDPATALTAPLSELASRALGLDEISADVARKQVEHGLELARAAGFIAQSRIAQGKSWRVICEIGDELEAEAIVVGARGLSRVQSALLGSVSAAVVQHARRPVLVVPHNAERPGETGRFQTPS
jgi:nucleotide-binding universal stress UspA family protein